MLVDSPSSQQNVKRFLESQGFEVAVGKEGNDYIVVGKCGGAPEPAPETDAKVGTGQKKIMVMCATDRIGLGDDQLGLKLMLNFLRTLKEMRPELWRLVFVNNGVKLASRVPRCSRTFRGWKKMVSRSWSAAPG